MFSPNPDFLDFIMEGIVFFTFAFIAICYVLLFFAKRRYKGCTKQIKGQFVKWYTITVNPKIDKKYYYPIFRYRYNGETYESHTLSGWVNKIPVLYQRQYPIWVNPKKPNLIAVHKEEYKDLKFQKV